MLFIIVQSLYNHEQGTWRDLDPLYVFKEVGGVTYEWREAQDMGHQKCIRELAGILHKWTQLVCLVVYAWSYVSWGKCKMSVYVEF